MRNSGWYIPFWRKPKRGQSDGSQGDRPEKDKRRRPRTRSDDELERVRIEWAGRYTRQVQAFRLLGLSVGTPQDEILVRYRELVANVGQSERASERLRELHVAYETLREHE